MDADHLEPPRADVAEPVGGPGRGHDDVAGSRLQLLAVDAEERPTGPDDPGLRVRVAVQRRALAGIEVDQEERDFGTVRPALEPDGAAAVTGLGGLAQDAEHSPSSG
jgi:hypothetical protein